MDAAGLDTGRSTQGEAVLGLLILVILGVLVLEGPDMHLGAVDLLKLDARVLICEIQFIL